MKRLAIIGASGHGKVVADCAQLCGWETIEFFDDAWPDKKLNGRWPIMGNTSSLLQRIDEFSGVAIAIGDNHVRDQKIRLFSEHSIDLPVLLHPGAHVSRFATLGAGTVVFAGAVVNADARTGIGAIINTSATVDHDCVLEDVVHISPGAHLAGGVWVGSRSWLGIGSSVVPGVKIGNDVVIGAGAVVTADIDDGIVAVGVPARRAIRSQKTSN